MYIIFQLESVKTYRPLTTLLSKISAIYIGQLLLKS